MNETHETRAHDKPARRARRSVLGRRRGSGRDTGPARRVSGLSTAPQRSPSGPHSIARRSKTHIARTLTTPREPTATSLSGARREINLRLQVEHDEAVAADVAHSPLADRRVRSRHQQGGSASQRAADSEAGGAQTRDQARPLKALERKTGRLREGVAFHDSK